MDNAVSKMIFCEMSLCVPTVWVWSAIVAYGPGNKITPVKKTHNDNNNNDNSSNDNNDNDNNDNDSDNNNNGNFS